jgi:hypothetical protein
MRSLKFRVWNKYMNIIKKGVVDVPTLPYSYEGECAYCHCIVDDIPTNSVELLGGPWSHIKCPTKGCNHYIFVYGKE